MQVGSSLLALPEHILFKILSYTEPLPESYLRYAQVCRLLYRICTSSLAWIRFEPHFLSRAEPRAFTKWKADSRSTYEKYLEERRDFSKYERLLHLQQRMVPSEQEHEQFVKEMIKDRSEVPFGPCQPITWIASNQSRVIYEGLCKYPGGGVWRWSYQERHLFFSDVGTSAFFQTFHKELARVELLFQISSDPLLSGADPQLVQHCILVNSAWPETSASDKENLKALKGARKLPPSLYKPTSNIDVLMAAAECRTMENVYELIDLSLRSNRKFMREFFRVDGWQIRYASENEKDDHEFVAAAFGSFCDRELLKKVTLRSREIALAAISFDANLFWEFEYRDDEFKRLAMAANCTLWDTVKSAALAHIAASQDWRCWREVRKLYEVPEPITYRFGGYRKEEPEAPVARRRIRLVLYPDETRKLSHIWERHVRFAEYRVDILLRRPV